MMLVWLITGDADLDLVKIESTRSFPWKVPTFHFVVNKYFQTMQILFLLTILPTNFNVHLWSCELI